MASQVKFSSSFSAETGVAEANVKRYASQIQAVNAELKAAERAAKQSYNEQSQAARAVGASTETLNKITQEYNSKLYAIGMTAKQVGQTLQDANRGAISSENAKTQAIELTNKELAAQIVEVNALAAANSKGNHEAISGVQATSAAIRGVEGSGGIRAIENFVSKTLGLGPAMQAIFPIVGAAMFGKMLVDVGVHIYEVEEKAAHAAEATTAAFEEMHSKAQIQIDDLTITADKLQDNIDKVSGHPGNGLQTALDEARRYADKLMESLKGDNKELQALFKENNVGMFAGALSGVASTSKQEEQLLADRAGLTQQFSAINADYNRELANAKSTDAVKAAGEKRDNAVRTSVQRTIDIYKTEAGRLRKEQTESEITAQQDTNGSTVSKDNRKKIANITGDTGQLQDFLNQQTAQKRVADLTEKDGAVKLAKEQAEQAKRSAAESKKGSNEALAAARKAASDQRKLWEDQYADWSSASVRSASDVALYWTMKAVSAKAGSDNYLEAEKKSNEAIRTMHAETARLEKENSKILDSMWNDMQKSERKAADSGFEAIAQRGSDLAKALQDGLKARRGNDNTLAQTTIDQEEATGQITRADAAFQRAALHASEYAQALADINEQRNAVRDDDPDRAPKLAKLGAEQAKLDGANAVTVMQDNSKLAAASWQGALKNANAVWVQDSLDSARQIASLYQSALGGLNNSLVSVMTGGKGNFGNLVKNIGGQLSNIGLQKIEGGLLGKLGKSDGSKGNPHHVIVDNPLGAATSSATSLMPGKSGGGFLGSVLSMIPGFAGFRADGGGVGPGESVMIGERGPELLTMGSTGGHVTPNHRMAGAYSDSGGDIHIHVDASGSSDPAQVRFQARMGAMEGHAAASRVQADHQAERKRRTPASRF